MNFNGSIKFKEKEVFDFVEKTIVGSITSYTKNRKKAKFQILGLIITIERRIRSIEGGLETASGTTLWEPLANTLAKKWLNRHGQRLSYNWNEFRDFMIHFAIPAPSIIE